MYYNMDMGYYDQYRELNRLDTLNNMIVEAMKAERHDRVKYQRLMEMTNDPFVKKQIDFAYEDEIKHYKIFQQIYYQLTGKTMDIPLPTDIEKYNTLLTAVQSSIEGENEAVDLYRQIYALMTNKQMRDKIFEIITDVFVKRKFLHIIIEKSPTQAKKLLLFKPHFSLFISV